jgi:hypothetical protein
MPQIRRYPSGAERQRAYRQRHQQLPPESVIIPPGIIPQQPSIPLAPAIGSMPAQARWGALIHQADSTLRIVHGEMESYFQDRSQSWQEDERGEVFQEKIQALEELIDGLQELLTQYFPVRPKLTAGP